MLLDMIKRKKIKELIKNCDAILITTGAGMGVDSGLPDFRGDEGFWKAYPPIKEMGLSFQEMANPSWFKKDPALAWAFYGHRLNLYRETVPHDGFKMLLDLVKEKKDNYFLYTSNVDGQFQKAGFDESKIYEVHGSIHHLQCSKRCTNDIWDNDEYMEVDMEKFEALNIPLCPHCGAVARPNILMFGDWEWNSQRSSYQEFLYKQWKNENFDKKIVIIEIGAGTHIPTVRKEGEFTSKNFNATLIRINPRDFQLDKGRGYSIELGGVDGLKMLLYSEII